MGLKWEVSEYVSVGHVVSLFSFFSSSFSLALDVAEVSAILSNTEKKHFNMHPLILSFSLTPQLLIRIEIKERSLILCQSLSN